MYEDVSLDADALRSRIDRDIDAVKKYVGWIHELSDPYDQELPGLIRSAIKGRKERLLKGRNTVAAIGLPVRRSDEPDGYRLEHAPEFVFSAEGDDQREIRLALLTFVIPKKKS